MLSSGETEVTGKPFRFKQFLIHQDRCAMKVGTDGILLGAWANTAHAGKVLDIGAGSGLIAIMIAQRTQDTLIHGVEIDEIASEQARENMQQSPWSDRLQIFRTSIQAFAKESDQQYDLIVSNPPFFTGGTFSTDQQKAFVRHTVKLSHSDLLGAVRTLLHKNGKFSVILPYLEGLRFVEVAATYHLYCSHMTEVRPKAGKNIERLLLQFEMEQQPMIQDELIIQNEKNNDYTEAFVNLTKDYYMNM